MFGHDHTSYILSLFKTFPLSLTYVGYVLKLPVEIKCSKCNCYMNIYVFVWFPFMVGLLTYQYFYGSLFLIKTHLFFCDLRRFKTFKREYWTHYICLTYKIVSIHFSPNWPTGRCPSLSILSPSHAIFFEASHWPSDHMISLRPLIGQPSFPTVWYFFC